MLRSAVRLTLALVVVAVLGGAACATAERTGGNRPTPVPRGSGPTTPAAASRPGNPRGLPDFSRVVIIVMENKEYGTIIGGSDAPYTNKLARTGALATNFFAITHPSMPNYLAMIGGSTFGITSNCTDCRVSQPSLVGQLEARSISWKAYMEGLPEPCFLGPSAGRYAKKHNPFAYFDDITGDPARCAKVVPLTQLDTDIADDDLPRFVFITPDLCHDTHDCSVRTGDDFLAGLVPRLLRELGPRGVLFLTYDEGTTRRGCCTKAAGGHIVTIAAGSAPKPGRYNADYTLYSLLRTIEDAWGLPRLGEAACPCTRSLTAMFRS